MATGANFGKLFVCCKSKPYSRIGGTSVSAVARIRARAGRLLERARHPRRFFAWLALRNAYARRSLRVSALPITLDVEPINMCNFRCNHCQVTHWSKDQARLDVDAFKRILDQFPLIEKVKLQGMGEPLLNKQLVPMLAEGERRGIALRFHSNGSVYTEAISDALSELDNTEIVFSIDGATADTFHTMRPGSNFEKVRENVKRFAARRGGGKSPTFAAWTVVTKDNVAELPDIVSLCSELGLDHVTVQPFLTDWGKTEMSEHVRPLELETERVESALSGARAAASTAAIDLHINEGDRYSRSKPCQWPWQSSYIAANGDVVPCCIIADADVAKMGNVFEKPMTEIWNGPEYQTLRAKIRDHDLPSYCKDCYFNEAEPAALAT
jgi:radical SAM protein with 4Fe4S-binding SPASM domain